MTIAQNINRRQETSTAVLLLIEEATKLAADVDAAMFWEGLAVAAMDRAGITREEVAADPADGPMTDEEARQFGKWTIGFGKYAGKRYNDVPLDYLTWLDGTQWTQAKQLHRYVESDYVQREIQEDE